MFAIGSDRYSELSDPSFLCEFDIQKPTPRPNDVIVEIKAIAVNPVDTKIRKALPLSPLPEPKILGCDASGIICDLGTNVSNFSIGDEVFYAGDLTRQGCYATHQAVDSRLIALKPKSWSFAHAASIPVASITAWELLYERMGIDPNGADSGKKILIINGAGGVGSAAITLAKQAGLTVIATASRPVTKLWCQKLGADHVINHHLLEQEIETLNIESFPYIANFHRPDLYWNITSKWIAPFGTIGLIVEPNSPLHLGDPLKAKCVRIAWEFMAARSKFNMADMSIQGEILTKIAKQCDAGVFPKITTRIDHSFSRSLLHQAHTALEHGNLHGKWALLMNPISEP